MDVMEAMRQRHSYRSFTDEPVDHALLRARPRRGATRALRDERAAVEVPRRDGRDPRAGSHGIMAADDRLSGRLSRQHGPGGQGRGDDALRERTSATLPSSSRWPFRARTTRWRTLNTMISAGAAIENLLLAATAYGLATCNVTFSYWVRDDLAARSRSRPTRSSSPLSRSAIRPGARPLRRTRPTSSSGTTERARRARSRRSSSTSATRCSGPGRASPRSCVRSSPRPATSTTSTAIDELMPLVDEFYEDRYRADDTFWTSEEETSEVWIGMYSLLCRKLGIDENAEALAAARLRGVRGPAPLASLRRRRPVPRPAARVGPGDGSRLQLGPPPCAVFSTAWASTTLLDTVVSSAEVGLHKPDPRIFETACERLGVPAQPLRARGRPLLRGLRGSYGAGHEGRADRPSWAWDARRRRSTPITTLDDLDGVLGM